MFANMLDPYFSISFDKLNDIRDLIQDYDSYLYELDDLLFELDYLFPVDASEEQIRAWEETLNFACETERRLIDVGTKLEKLGIV